MKIFNRKSKGEEKQVNNSEFNQEQYMTGGNLYDSKQRLRAQTKVDLQTIPYFNNVNKSIQDTLKTISDRFIDNYALNDYYLLQLHANYFVNTIVYKCNNPTFNSTLRQVIRFAWLNGKAGIYFDKSINKYYGIIIDNYKMNLYGEIEEISYWPVAYNLDATYDDIKNKKTFKIKGEECKNAAIFRWGTAAISAWIMYFPFVKFQNMLLKMISVQSLAYNRKYIYDVINPNADLKEMELWYDPLNVFIVNTMGDGISNKFRVNDSSGENMVDFIVFYKQAVSCYYSLFGRRANLDFKKERNTIEEVSLTSGAIENLERDWYAEFNIFAHKIMEINSRLNIVNYLEINEIRLNNWIREERINGDLTEHDNRIKSNIQGEK